MKRKLLWVEETFMEKNTNISQPTNAIDSFHFKNDAKAAGTFFFSKTTQITLSPTVPRKSHLKFIFKIF